VTQQSMVIGCVRLTDVSVIDMIHSSENRTTKRHMYSPGED